MEFNVLDESKKRILAIDDCREISFAEVLCRTYSSGIVALERLGPWDELFLDHDLGALRIDRNDNGRELTGHDVAKWLVANPNHRPAKINVVTGNPSGLVNITAALIDAGYEKVNERNFELKE